MPFNIEANLLQGEPRLRIFDANSGAVRLHWRYRSGLIQHDPNLPLCSEDHQCTARANLHTLMRELFLLSCIGNPQLLTDRDAVNACLVCQQCVSGSPAVPLAVMRPGDNSLIFHGDQGQLLKR